MAEVEYAVVWEFASGLLSQTVDTGIHLKKMAEATTTNLASTLAAAHSRRTEAEEQAARAQAAGRRAISSTAGEFSSQEAIESVQVDAMVRHCAGILVSPQEVLCIMRLTSTVAPEHRWL